MVRNKLHTLAALLLGVGTLGIAACESQGRFEEAGEELDEAVEEVEEEFRDEE